LRYEEDDDGGTAIARCLAGARAFGRRSLGRHASAFRADVTFSCIAGGNAIVTPIYADVLRDNPSPLCDVPCGEVLSTSLERGVGERACEPFALVLGFDAKQGSHVLGDNVGRYASLDLDGRGYYRRIRNLG